MIITTTTTISFLIPENDDEYKAFVRSHDMEKWKMTYCISSLITLEQTQTVFTTITMEGKPEPPKMEG